MNLLATFSDLTTPAIRAAIARLGADGLVCLQDACMPEADVLLCSFQGKRFNIRVDLVYGAEVDDVARLDDKEREHIMRIIVTRCAQHSAPTAGT